MACGNIFIEFINYLLELDPNNPAHAAALRFRQGTNPDLMIDTRSMDSSGNVSKSL